MGSKFSAIAFAAAANCGLAQAPNAKLKCLDPDWVGYFFSVFLCVLSRATPPPPPSRGSEPGLGGLNLSGCTRWGFLNPFTVQTAHSSWNMKEFPFPLARWLLLNQSLGNKYAPSPHTHTLLSICQPISIYSANAELCRFSGPAHQPCLGTERHALAAAPK